MPDTPDHWELVDGALRRELRFADFDAAFAFMTRVALLAAKADHHPDWSNSYDTVVISLVSHDRGEVTERDRRLAEQINEVVSGQ